MPLMTSSKQSQEEELTLSPAEFTQVRDILARYSGVYLDQSIQRVLTSGLAHRMIATDMSFDSYVAHISQLSGQTELQALAELVLNHETVFFRNQPHIRALRDFLLPQLHRRKPAGEPIRIWSAGCSTGEEPYSLAITAFESLGSTLPRPVQIWATDLSEAALEKARLGVYRGRTLTNVSSEVRNRYFEYQVGNWRVNSKVRNLITFAQFNLLTPFPHHIRGVDIIFCQNVTIYFELATFRALVDRFYQILPNKGLLFLGFSETLWNIYDKFQLREVANAFIYMKDVAPLPEVPSKPTLRQDVPSGSSKKVEEPPSYRARLQQKSQVSRSDKAHQPKDTQVPDMEKTLHRGRELLDAGQVDDVLDMLYKVPLNGPHAPKTMALIARAHANRGDLDVAVAEARRAIELNSLTTDAYILLGILYARQGQMQEASQQLERARYLDPETALISFHLAEVYRQSKRFDSAIREYRNTLRKLQSYTSDALLDGVGVGLLRETCERYLKMLK